jgi:hypothetical protein
MKSHFTYLNLSVHMLAIAASLGLGAVLGVSSFEQSALAQTIESQQPREYQSNEEDTFGRNALGGFNAMELMHRANLSRSRDSAEFQEDTNTNLDKAAQEFKRLQLQRLQNSQQQPSPNAAQ